VSDDRKERVLELIQELNDLGEHERIEAKLASELGKSVLETVSAFSNEPGLGGGFILLGVARNISGDLFEPPKYEVVGVPNPEKVADDLASQCASTFNRPVRPRIEPTLIGSKTVILVTVNEVSPGEKPIFLRKYGLPGGAFRRIGATDQGCTEDDIQVLYDAKRRTPYDADVVPDAELSDLDPDAIDEYRRLRREVAPGAPEIEYRDEDLLLALNCVRKVDGELRPTVAGILLFGIAIAMRRFFGMMRVDYIRVPGREWVPNPAERYSSVEIRAPLIRAVWRAEAAVLDDLPKAFRLPEGSLHREDVPPLP
jgi:ATP-dependent DNA helicase RecG